MSGYNYAELLENITALETPLSGPALRLVRTAERGNSQVCEQPFTEQALPHPVNQWLQSAEIRAGWICWPSEIETITATSPARLDSVLPPLAAELLLGDGSHINLTHSSGRWYWCQTRLDFNCLAERANALAQPFTVRSNTPGLVLEYWRIWRWREQQGMVLEDALFAGFREEKR